MLKACLAEDALIAQPRLADDILSLEIADVRRWVQLQSVDLTLLRTGRQPPLAKVRMRPTPIYIQTLSERDKSLLASLAAHQFLTFSQERRRHFHGRSETLPILRASLVILTSIAIIVAANAGTNLCLAAIAGAAPSLGLVIGGLIRGLILKK